MVASGLLFATRGAALQCGAGWPTAMPVRRISYAIDTVLLAAALMLVSIVRQYPFVNGWLTAKLCLLMVYIALGILALRYKTRPQLSRACYFVALFVYADMVSIAIEHDPRGLLLMLGR